MCKYLIKFWCNLWNKLRWTSHYYQHDSSIARPYNKSLEPRGRRHHVIQMAWPKWRSGLRSKTMTNSAAITIEYWKYFQVTNITSNFRTAFRLEWTVFISFFWNLGLTWNGQSETKIIQNPSLDNGHEDGLPIYLFFSFWSPFSLQQCSSLLGWVESMWERCCNQIHSARLQWSLNDETVLRNDLRDIRSWGFEMVIDTQTVTSSDTLHQTLTWNGLTPGFLRKQDLLTNIFPYLASRYSR